MHNFKLLSAVTVELISLQMLIIFMVLQACYLLQLGMASVDLWERNYNRSKVRLRLELTFVHHSRKVGNVQLSLGLQKVIA